MVQDRLGAVLGAAVLFCLIAMAAAAEEKHEWHGEKGEGVASLFYGRRSRRRSLCDLRLVHRS